MTYEHHRESPKRPDPARYSAPATGCNCRVEAGSGTHQRKLFLQRVSSKGGIVEKNRQQTPNGATCANSTSAGFAASSWRASQVRPPLAGGPFTRPGLRPRARRPACTATASICRTTARRRPPPPPGFAARLTLGSVGGPPQRPHELPCRVSQSFRLA